MAEIIKYLKLYIGIITKPTNTFERIKKGNHIYAGLIIWFLSSFLYLFITSLIIQKESNVNSGVNVMMVLSFIPLLLLKYKTTIKIFFLYMGVFIVNTIAVKLFKNKSDYLGLLTCVLYISVLEVLHLSLIILITAYTAIPYSLSSLINYIFIPWSIILNIIAIKTSYNISFRKACEILFTFCLLGIVFICIWVIVDYFN